MSYNKKKVKKEDSSEMTYHSVEVITNCFLRNYNAWEFTRSRLCSHP